MYELLSVPHESEVMSMWKGIYGIFSNVSYSNFAFVIAFSLSIMIRDNA